MTGAAVRALPWRPLVAATVAGTALCLVLMLANLSSTRDTFGGLVVAQPDALAAPVLRAELGDDAVGPGGHDSAYFYVVARDPFDLDQAPPGWTPRCTACSGSASRSQHGCCTPSAAATAWSWRWPWWASSPWRACACRLALSATFGGSALVAVVPGSCPERGWACGSAPVTRRRWPWPWRRSSVTGAGGRVGPWAWGWRRS
ncbi:MAG: hypothetical protein R2699_03130 [Acidimicrobiales bacterium]